MGTCCTTVGQSEIAVLESCGAFSAVAGPGLHCILPWTARVGTLSMRLIEHSFIVRSKTKGNVFVNGHCTPQCPAGEILSRNKAAAPLQMTSQGNVQTNSNPRRLDVDVPELTETLVQNISKMEATGQLDYLTIRLHRITTAPKILCTLLSLKELNLSNTRITYEEVRLLSKCHTLLKIDLHSCKALRNADPLAFISQLEEINLSDCTSLTHVGALGKLPALKELYLSYTRITDEEIRQLSKCHTLVKIDLCCCTLLTNVDPLASIATLEVINLSRCTSLTNVCALGKFPALKELYLNETHITDKEIRQLSKCHSLVKIELSSCKALTNVDPLSSVSKLEEVNLSGCTSLTHVGALGKLPVLREVNLGYTCITKKEIQQISKCHTLVKIELSCCTSLTNVDTLSSIATLKVINLSGCTSLTHVGELCKFPALREVDVGYTRIKDEEIRQLSECHTLVKIDLCSCILLTNVDPLAFISKLETIDLSGCSSLTHVGALGRLPVLRELYLSETHITDEEIRQLSECHTLVKIDLWSCKALTNVNPLSSIGTLKVINLSNCTSLTHVGALGRLPVLRELYLSETRIMDEEIRQLSESNALMNINLKSCKTLTNINPLASIVTLEVINLSDCTYLTHVGALGKLPAMKELYLCETPITDEEIRLMNECRTLVNIYLQSCEALINVDPLALISKLEKVDLSGCTSLTHVGALGKLPALRELYLSDTRITDEEIRHLSECHTLVVIELRSCKALVNVNPLSSIATLEIINLSDCTSLTHAGALGTLPALKELYLSDTRITDKDVRQLSESNTLVKMDLHSCEALTNVNPLSSIATLEIINLSDCTSLTHVGALGMLPVLKEVDLMFTGVTDEEIRQLSECLHW